MRYLVTLINIKGFLFKNNNINNHQFDSFYVQIIKGIVFNPKMDRNSLSKSSESNNTIDEPEFENVHSVAEHEAIELSGEEKAKSIVSKSTRMVKIDTCLLKPKANATKLTTEDIEERRKSKSNVIQYLTNFLLMTKCF